MKAAASNELISTPILCSRFTLNLKRTKVIWIFVKIVPVILIA
jgi:hypothetical protein